MRPRQLADMYGWHVVFQASPVERVLLLYDRAIVLLKQATAALAAHQLREKGEALSRALDILVYLHASLDHDRGLTIAARLDQLYRYMLWRLTTANLANDPVGVAEVIQLLATLREGWQGVVRAAASAPQPRAASRL
ncbi:flagellar export chaperone FliS [Nitrospira sp. Kam-Ns4a]